MTMPRLPDPIATPSQNVPAAHRNHPVNAVLRDGETFRELAKKVEYCEITWPQCYVMGEPIRIYTT
jgi:hypothetical protein